MILRNPPEVPEARFTIYSLKVFHKMLHFLTPYSCGCSLLFRPLLLLAVFLHVLRCGVSSTCRLLIPFLHPDSFLIPGAAKSFVDSQFSSVRIFLKTFLLHRATVARRDAFLKAAVNFLQDPQSPRVSSLGSPHHLAVSFRPLCHFLSPLTGITTSSVGIS
jgi:hypothetical protein